jgi:hypothetical protein
MSPNLTGIRSKLLTAATGRQSSAFGQLVFILTSRLAWRLDAGGLTDEDCRIYC